MTFQEFFNVFVYIWINVVFAIYRLVKLGDRGAHMEIVANDISLYRYIIKRVNGKEK
jgi:hypothetical protein